MRACKLVLAELNGKCELARTPVQLCISKVILRNATCRYTVKNKELDQEGWDVVYACGGCREENFIGEAYLAWRVSSKKRIFIGKHAIKPTNAAKTIVEFRGRQLRSLQMHPAQYVRLMLNSGLYILGPEMVASGATLNTIVLAYIG